MMAAMTGGVQAIKNREQDYYGFFFCLCNTHAI